MITYENITITPKMASEMLKRANPNNRRINHKRVYEFAATMKQGGWQNNGEGIAFDESGMLLNGHHRLNGIIYANTPVKMTVIKGVPNGTTIYDRGGNRNTANTLALAGVKVKAKTVAAIKLLYRKTNPGRAPSDDKVLKYCSANAENLRLATEIASYGKATKKIGDKAPVVLAIYVALRNNTPASVLYSFMNCVNTGFCDGERQTAAITLRNYIVQNPATGDAAANKLLSVALKAIKDFKDGVPRRTYRNVSDTGMLVKVVNEDTQKFGEKWEGHCNEQV